MAVIDAGLRPSRMRPVLCGAVAALRCCTLSSLSMCALLSVSARRSELRANMIHRMTLDNSREATFVRVGHVCQTAYVALRRGLANADRLHQITGWNPAADIHLHRHMTRRDAMEDLKQVSTGDVLLDDDDNLGLAMSGLIVELPEDMIRIWHTTESDVPAPRSEAGREFITQSTVAPALFVADELPYDAKSKMRFNSLIIQWTAQGQEILRYDLIRPVGYKNGKVEIDWRYPLLAQYKAMPDITYRLRDDEDKSGDAEDT